MTWTWKMIATVGYKVQSLFKNIFVSTEFKNSPRGRRYRDFGVFLEVNWLEFNFFWNRNSQGPKRIE